MAEFVEDFNSLRSAMTLIDMDPTLEMMSNFPELSATVLENPSLGLSCCSNDSFLSHEQLQLPALYVEGSSGLPPVRCPAETWPFGSPTMKDGRRTSKRKKASAEADSACAIGSVPLLQNGSSCAEVKAKKKSSSCKAKERCSGKEWKPGEVVHVRAKRGQATDRHSLAERVRRGKINEKIRCLQGLVPGCYKAMGMAVMLDEIIKYVQSLQNQVEFLSMKLSAASAVYDLNLDLLDAAAVMPQLLPRVDDADDARGANSLMTGGYEGCSSFQPF